MAKTRWNGVRSVVEDAPVVVPVVFPEIDGGGDPECVIYVEQSGSLVPYAAQSDRRFRVTIGGVEHLHVGEHEGRWVYRAS